MLCRRIILFHFSFLCRCGRLNMRRRGCYAFRIHPFSILQKLCFWRLVIEVKYSMADCIVSVCRPQRHFVPRYCTRRSALKMPRYGRVPEIVESGVPVPLLLPPLQDTEKYGFSISSNRLALMLHLRMSVSVAPARSTGGRCQIRVNCRSSCFIRNE